MLKNSPQVNHWIICITEDNRQIAFRERVMGFSDAKAGRLKSFRAGDLVIFYVPRESLSSSKKIGKFIGVAEIKGENYESNTAMWQNGLFPQRLPIEILSERSCDIGPLISGLTFIKNKKSWGGTFLAGILKVPAEDFQTIRKSMNLPS